MGPMISGLVAHVYGLDLLKIGSALVALRAGLVIVHSAIELLQTLSSAPALGRIGMMINQGLEYSQKLLDFIQPRSKVVPMPGVKDLPPIAPPGTSSAL